MVESSFDQTYRTSKVLDSLDSANRDSIACALQKSVFLSEDAALKAYVRTLLPDPAMRESTYCTQLGEDLEARTNSMQP